MKRILTLVFFVLTTLCLTPAVKAHGHESFFASPSVPATAVSATGIDGDRATVYWTAGNGAKRLVIVSKDSAVTVAPAAGLSYTANATFGTGTELLPGQFVTYDGAANAFDLYGLIPAHTYYVAVFEYNGSSFTTEYLTVNPGRGSFSTRRAPTQAATALIATAVTGNSVNLSWIKGNGDRRLVVARRDAPVNANPTDMTGYNGDASFGSGSVIGSGNYAVYAGSGTGGVIKNLEPGTTYHFAAFEYNAFWAPVYLTSSPATGSFTTVARPSVTASAMVLSGTEGNSMLLTLSKGNGARRLVVVRAGSPVSALPADGTEYTANRLFGAGASLAPGEFVLANADLESVEVENLSAATTYYYAVFEYDGTGTNTRYLTASFASASRSTIMTPTVQASAIGFSEISNGSAKISFAAGNGSRRLIVAKEDAAVSFVPANATAYGTSTVFGSSAVGTGGNYGISTTTETSVTMTGLTAGKTYYVSVFEYNGFFSPVYNAAAAPVGSFTTAVTPTAPSSGMGYGGAEGNKQSFYWTPGNGTRRIVIARAGSPVTAQPADGMAYTANAVFGSGTALAPGQFAVYDGAGSNFEMKGLLPNTTYHLSVFEYSTAGGTPYYLRSAVLNGSRATAAAPATASSAFSATVTSNTVRVNFTPGSGSRRLIIMNRTAPVSVSLNDLQFYSGGTNLGGGNEILTNTGDNAYAVYGLAPNTTLHFAVIEMNGFDAPVYLQSTQLSGSATTSARPSAEPNGAYFTGTEGNRLTFQWTSGNGTKRLVVAKKGSPVTAMPADGMTYIARDTLGRGTQLAPGEFVVDYTTSFYTTVKGLDTSATYYFAVFEADGDGANTGYLTAKYLATSATTVGVPTVPATNVNFSNIAATTATIGWTAGNGANRLVVMHKGAPVTALPPNFSSYPYGTAFGSVPLAAGDYIIYKDNLSSTPVYNLEPGTTYHVAVFEYNGYGAPVYLTANPARGTVTTLGPPAVQASNLAFTHHQLTSATLNWQAGSGQKRIVVARKGAPVDFVPADRTGYTVNSFFGAGQMVGTNNYIVYNGNGENVNITALNRDDNYHFAIFEYNQFPTGEVYKSTAAPTAVLLAKPYIYDTTALAGMSASFTVTGT